MPWEGFVKPTFKAMAKSQKGGSQPPKKQSNTMYNFGSVHTGSAKTDPGVLKAQKDKAVRDAAADKYKKKADVQKAAAIKKAKGK